MPTTIADLNRACAAGTVLNVGHHHDNRYRIVGVAECHDNTCPIGPTCVATIDLLLISNPRTAVDQCHVAESYTLPIAADTLPVAA